MKKKVNGKIVNISNMDLFEKAFEGLALGRLVSSSVADIITENTQLINDCISLYEKVCKLLPFPLYAIEENIKYSMIATYIKDALEVKDIWVDNAIYIRTEPSKALKLAGNTWGIVPIQTDREYDDNINIELYNNDVGYSEFKWALTKLMNGESLKDYYERFMRGFMDACNREPTVLKWELGHMLDFGFVPEKLNLKENRLLDVDTGSEYFLDIFSTGKRKTGESEYVFSIGGENSGLRKQSKYIKTFDFEVYEKKAQPDDIMASSNIGKLQKCNLEGIAALFETLAGKSSIQDGIEGINYTGIIADNIIIYQVGSQIYRCGAEKYNKAIEIAKTVELYSYANGLVYMIKKSLCPSGITKEAIYAYGIKDESIRLCKIQFS